VRAIGRTLLILGVIAGSGGPALAQGDAIFRAMRDELDRSMSDLRLEGMPAPYFLSYRVLDSQRLSVEARLGALVETARGNDRRLYVECRVGDPALDNSNYVGRWQDLNRWPDGLVEEDDYHAIRHRIWLATDEAYKNALENLARKQAYLQAHPPKEIIPDFTAVPVFEYMSEPAVQVADVPAWEERVRVVAGALREYPALQDWQVRYTSVVQNRRYLNSEGSRHLTAKRWQALLVAATAQAEDGQRITSHLREIVCNADNLPETAAFVQQVRALAQELDAMVKAPALEEYAGPVLFEGRAAAQLVSQLFAAQLSPPRTLLTDVDWLRQQLAEPKLARRIGRRVFPASVTIKDDPALETWDGLSLVGHRRVDDEGVACEAVTLVEDGRLVALPMSRQPIKKLTRSNGHAFTFENQWTEPIVSSLLVQTSQPSPDLVADLRRLCREAGLEFGLVVTGLEDPELARGYRWTEPDQSSEELLTAPVGMYKIYESDGRREPVRGLVFDEVTIRALRDVAAVGSDATAYNVSQSLPIDDTGHLATIITPDILIEEMDLKAGSVHEPLPLTANPMFAN
jgi:TldD protein